MAVIGLQGLRGGVGTTSIAAGLGWSLQQQGESVLVVGAAPDNLLRLLFNIGFAQSAGWAYALHEGLAWQSAAWRYTPRLDVLPYGQLNAMQSSELLARAEGVAHFLDALKTLKQSGRYRWILVDIPAGFSAFALEILAAVDSRIVVATPDANCHARLHQQPLAQDAYLLVNGLRVASHLQDDIYQLWLQSQRSLVPVILHSDEAMAEAMAAKQPVGEYSPASLVAEELMTLAGWCLLNLAEPQP
jgi:cellulose synthase operon protein YhjQ